MRHQYRQLRIGQNVARGAAEDHLAQAALRIGAFDDEVATEFVRLGEDSFTGARLPGFIVMVSDAMPFILSDRAICSPLGPATVAPSTVKW